uniref:Gnk2-homologous domain-containing protein n=1 Tax=Fagus sylvatica TaxID=28930 RepID=A0A2N9EUV7_FAGSY
MGSTISLPERTPTKFTPLDFVEQILLQLIAVAVSICQLTSSYSCVQHKKRALSTVSVVSNVSEFNEVLKTLLYDLRVKAAAGGIYRKIANENANFQNNTVYGLMQCSPDLSEMDCSNCLVDAHNELLKCCK